MYFVQQPNGTGLDVKVSLVIILESALFSAFFLYYSCFCINYFIRYLQGCIKRFRRSWPTNSALVYEPKCGRGRGCRGVPDNVYSSQSNELSRGPPELGKHLRL
jgi:hypothetical protein